ncbi:MAG: hypothetical protein U0836_24945 [Pirellulales bacterium]
MDRDIDYAAVAVRNAIVEKFGRQVDLDDLQVIAGERTIELRHGDLTAAGTRDALLAILRKASEYQNLWS